MNITINNDGLVFDGTRDRMVSGSVGTTTCTFAFGEHHDLWDGLVITAVWRNGDALFEQPVTDGQTLTVPHEVMAEPGGLYVGVYGVRKDGKVVRPELWVQVGQVLTGVPMNKAATSKDPSLSSYQLAYLSVRDVVDHELTRESGERARRDAEEARQKAEEARQKTVRDILASESTRQANETARESAESARQKAESGRVDAESKRVAAETARGSAEKQRAADAKARVDAENRHESIISGYELRLEDVEAFIGTERAKSMTPAEIQSVVAAGNGARYFPVGTVLEIPWTAPDGTAYSWKWRVIHHYDGSDDAHPLRVMALGGKKKPAMCIQAVDGLPDGYEFNAREAAYRAARAFTAGEHAYFSLNVTSTYGSDGPFSKAGNNAYVFDGTPYVPDTQGFRNSIPSGSQFVIRDNSTTGIIQFNVFLPNDGTDAANQEEAYVVESNGYTGRGATRDGTYLGRMASPDNPPEDHGWNTWERVQFGYTSWLDSSIRHFLNSDEAQFAETRTNFHRPASYSGKRGVLNGFDSAYKGILADVLNEECVGATTTGASTQLKKVSESDTLYLLSTTEYAAKTAYGSDAHILDEGVPMDYWTREAAKAVAKNGGTPSTKVALPVASRLDGSSAAYMLSRSRNNLTSHFLGAINGDGGWSAVEPCSRNTIIVPAACIA